MPRIRRVTRQTCAGTARNERLKPLPFATPCIHIYCENTGICTLLYFQTCTLCHWCHTNSNLLTEPPKWPSYSHVSHLLITLPLDWAYQLWATSWLLYHLTELVSCELLLDCSTTWLSWSMVSYLLMTLSLDWAIQWWATSWLLYRLTELFNGELPLDYSTTWLRYPIVRNYGSF